MSRSSVNASHKTSEISSIFLTLKIALNGLTLGSGGRFVGSSWGDSENTFKVGSVAVWNGLVSYELSQLGLRGANIALNVTNILDRKYVSSCFADYSCFRGAGRQMTATATFHF
ncbi:TPA: TonB-dependent receptor [Klebsiella variicola]|nr:TonB-dependent receptor [Klebsiella quasipneumoniae subsp. quasipneumoniae]HCI4651143.1 TonB-dependent receptor [Klebsiella quasipneumoniae subsp. quasipneumoniae]HCJ7666364.1 TonB-dependent receptor [Enterobacter hormaechei subsp. xiangfangensis]HCM8069527.1 TonB-dependent receptor [Klebsiella variicola]